MENASGLKAELELEAMNEILSGIGVFDITGSVIKMEYLNDGFYRMIGARREDRAQIFAEGTIQSVHPDDREGLLSEAKSCIHPGKETFRIPVPESGRRRKIYLDRHPREP
jgi:hypothetical protein